MGKKGSRTLKLQITVDGRAYAVEVEVLEDDDSAPAPGTAQHAANLPAGGSFESSSKGMWDAEEKVCRSPFMGLAVQVHVTPGQMVEAGTPMLVLEAMKMETRVTAPRAGRVKSIQVKQGDPVKTGQMLTELE